MNFLVDLRGLFKRDPGAEEEPEVEEVEEREPNPHEGVVVASAGGSVEEVITKVASGGACVELYFVGYPAGPDIRGAEPTYIGACRCRGFSEVPVLYAGEVREVVWLKTVYIS